MFELFIEWLDEHYNEVEKTELWNHYVQSGEYPNEFIEGFEEN